MMGFRDCMEEKKGRMLDMEAEEVGDIQGEICNGLKVSLCQTFSLVYFFCFWQPWITKVALMARRIFKLVCICISCAQGCF